MLVKVRGDATGAAALLREVGDSMRSRGDPALPILLLELGDNARLRGLFDEAARSIDEAAELSLLIAREWLLPECRVAQARLAMFRGQFDYGLKLAADALRLLAEATSTGAPRSPDPLVEALAHSVLARIAFYSHRVDEAHVAFHEALTILQRLGITPTIAEVKCDDALVLVALGRLDDARAEVEEAEQIMHPLDVSVFDPLTLRARAAICAAEGDLQTAVDYLERAVVSPSFADWPYEFGRTLLTRLLRLPA